MKAIPCPVWRGAHRQLPMGVVVLGVGALLGACGGDTSVDTPGTSAAQSTSAMMSTSSGPVVNHVHGAVMGVTPSQILLGTHYGLEVSNDLGTTWQPVPSVAGDSVAAIIRLPTDYVGAFEPMSATGRMAGPAYVMYSSDGQNWTRATGLAPGSISNLVAADSGLGAWASVTNVGIFHSVDGGHTWSVVLPTTKILTALEQVGPNLVFTTQDGIEVTSSTSPSMPASPVLTQSMNDMSPWSACPTCLLATLASGDIATSRDAGHTWETTRTGHAFDRVTSFPGLGTTLFGMVAAPVATDQGLWRSTDTGHTWTSVIKQPNVDGMLDVRGSVPALLAFQWGITVWRSANAGATWARLSSLTGAM